MVRRLNKYRAGDYNVICDRSGFKIKRSQAVRTWDGLLVKKEFAEPRHPQDFVRGVPERPSLKDTRPEQEDTFLADNEVKAEDL